jgi:Domain of unknown function (DUF4279)
MNMPSMNMSTPALRLQPPGGRRRLSRSLRFPRLPSRLLDSLDKVEGGCGHQVAPLRRGQSLGWLVSQAPAAASSSTLRQLGQLSMQRSRRSAEAQPTTSSSMQEMEISSHLRPARLSETWPTHARAGVGFMTRFAVSFRVTSKDLMPENITSALALAPSEAHKRGDPNVGNSGRRYADYSVGVWLLKSPLPEDAMLDEHLLVMVDKLEGRAGAIHELAHDHQVDFLIAVFGNGLGNFGFEISKEVLRAVAMLGVPLGFDVYEINDDSIGQENQ